MPERAALPPNHAAKHNEGGDSGNHQEGFTLFEVYEEGGQVRQGRAQGCV